MGDNQQGHGTPLSVRAMVSAVAALGAQLGKSQVGRDFAEGAPKHSARAYLAWRAAYRELGRTADSRIDRPQTSASNASAGEAANAGSDPPAGPASAGGEPSDEPADEPADEHTAAFRRDRAANERIKAERAQIELDQLRGSVVTLRDLEDFEFTAGRIVRDRIEQVPARLAADLHALVLTLIPDEHRAAVSAGLELHTFERRLADALREALADAAKATEDARRDDDDHTTH